MRKQINPATGKNYTNLEIQAYFGLNYTAQTAKLNTSQKQQKQQQIVITPAEMPDDFKFKFSEEYYTWYLKTHVIDEIDLDTKAINLRIANEIRNILDKKDQIKKASVNEESQQLKGDELLDYATKFKASTQPTTISR